MKIIVPGKPIAKARPRFYRKGNFAGTYDPQETEEGRWILFARSHLQKTGFQKIEKAPIILHLIFVMPLPKNWPQYKLEQMKRGKIFWHKKKPDLYNLAKFAEDCLKFCGVWTDDSQVAYSTAFKQYGLEPRTEIEIKEMYDAW